MNLMEYIVARLAYIDLVNECKAKDPNCEVPSIEELLDCKCVQAQVEDSTNKLREYLRRKYGN